MVRAARRKLDFIYVGAPKSGSSWLFKALRQHPGAYILPSKSSGHYDTDEPCPAEKHQALLDQADEGKLVGEIAHNAYLYPDTASRLRKAFPDVRVIVCLREPGDFAISTLKWWTTHTDRFGRDIAEMTHEPHFRKLMDYSGRLEPFYAVFPSGQIKVVFFDELARDPRGFYREVCTFLGLDSAFEPQTLTEQINRTRPPRFPLFTRGIYALGDIGRALGLATLVEWGKHVRLVDRILYADKASDTPPEMSAAAARERVAARRGLSKLERLIGRPVPSAWQQA
ncbi:MAG: sulfotransferase [Sphingomonadales bacterium]|nr:sulfotransferase [Sphingomonadales bacterium]MDE2569958.1 sulfotransferase [Sphingomonadales bacterium]